MAAAPPEDRPQVLNFGCRLNALEGDAMGAAAASAGLDRALIVNSCAVTGEAVRQARQAIRRAKRDDPALRVVVTGCAAQIAPEGFSAMGEVDLVLGNIGKTRPETWAKARGTLAEVRCGPAHVEVGDIMAERTALPLHAAPSAARTRAFVQVQTGCDHRCTFCVIPYGRGNSRSVPLADVVDEACRLADMGHREVVLTGVDLTSYGRDLPGAPSLGQLVRTLLREVPQLPRLRLSSLDAVEVDAALKAALADEERLMPHLHLSLQSGDDLVLKRMKRRHSRADALAFVAEMRRLRPDMVFGADLMAGFPTESEAQFRATLSLAEEAGLAFVHAFAFSARPGTPAARMPQLDHAIVAERAKRLRQAGAALLHRHLSGEVGARRAVLVESGGRGHTEHFTPVRLARPLARGTLHALRVCGHDGARLIAA